MSTLKSINWALAWRRTFWTSAFFAFLALVIYMAKDMANSQPVVFGVIVMTAVVGAVAFVYARTSKEALLIAVLAVSIDIFLHASYWSSVIDDISTQVLREQSAASARDVVNEKRRARYAASASGKGAAQLSAEIEVLKQDARWSASAQCSNATATASRAFCQDYYRLVAEHAAAKEASNLEQTVFHTTVEAVDLPRNLAKGAIWVADLTGMSVQDATNMLVALMVLFIQSGLAGSLRIGWAPEKPQEARTVEKAFAPISVASAPVQPVLAPRSPMVALEKMTGVSAVGTKSVDLAPKQPSVTNSGTDPDGPGTPIAKPEAPKEEVADTNVAQFPLKPRQETNAQYRIVPRIDGPKKRRERPATKEFFRQCLGIDKDAKAAILSAIRDKKPIEKHVAGRLMDASDVYGMYLEWWGEDGAISPKAFSNHLGDYLNIPKGTRKLKGVTGLRNKKGMKFPVYDARVAEPIRRTA